MQDEQTFATGESSKESIDLNARFDELMEFLKENMVTKTEFFALEKRVENLEQRFASLEQKVGSLEQKIDDALSELRSELRSIRERLDVIEERLGRVEKMAKEDTDALSKDFIDLRRRVEILERTVKMQGYLA